MEISLLKDVPGVYRITNDSNGKCYVGSSVKIRSRIRQHRNGLIANRHPNAHLQAAWNQCGGDKFSVDVLEMTAINDVRQAEQRHMDRLQSHNRALGYNLSLTADVVTFSEETKQRISRLKKGVPMSEQARANMSKGRKGLVFSAQHIAAMSRAQQGRKHSEQTRQKIAAANTGFVHSQETKDKLAAKAFGRKHSQEAKERMSIAQVGRIHSEETKKKISEANRGKSFGKGRVLSVEHCAKIGDARRGIKMSEETKRRISEAKTGKKIHRTAEHNAKIWAANRRRSALLEQGAGS